jgi:plastocyanin
MTPIKYAALLGCALLFPTGPAVAADAQVVIDNFSFVPAEIHVQAGTHVVWTNRDDIPHTVVDAANPRAIKSPPLDTGDQYARIFDRPGTYRYFCSLHPHMQGMVTVR